MILDFSQEKFQLIFEVTEEKQVVLRHFSHTDAVDLGKKLKWCQIAEVHLAGENPDDHHGAKHTGSSSVASLQYVSHRFDEEKKKLEFVLQDDKMQVTVHYQFYEGVAGLRSWTEVENIGKETIGLEYVSSFSYTGFDDGVETPSENIHVLIPHNAWKRELHWKEYSLRDFGLEHNGEFSTKRISLSNTGTWSTKEYLPMGGIVHQTKNSAYLWQIENNGSWQWEISDIADMLYLKLSGPTEQENCWYKELEPGKSFVSAKAAIMVGEDIQKALDEMTAYRRRIVRVNPTDCKLPVIFNDYMNCLWANPTTEKMIPVIDKAAQTGAEYYCMDAGWYADGTWWETVGEWQPCDWRFPGGIKEVFDYIKNKGMIPGIWLEIEVMGINCPLAQEWEDECFFMRHGKRVIDHGRYILDFRNKKVRDFATAVMDRVIGEYGVGYVKTDYNVDGGVGTEVDADSFGDGLLEHNRAFLSWERELVEKYPDLVIENCASGGLRMDYAMLGHRSIQSLSDQSDYKNIAVIAANAATAVLPEQAAVWSYPLASGDENEAAFNMANAMLNRIHLSGEIANWSEKQFQDVKEGVACYKEIREAISKAVAYFPLGINQYGAGFLCTGYRSPEKNYMTVWRLNAEEETVSIPVSGVSSAEIIYPSNTKGHVQVLDKELKATLPDQYSAMVLQLF